MDAHTTPRDERYDAIVVGSGLGGVSAAAVLAHAGRKVLVVEQGEGAGGYAHAFRRGPYTFDPAVHVLFEGEVIESLLDYLGVADRCMLRVVDDVYKVVFPGFRFTAPVGYEAFVEAHVRAFPHQAAALRDYLGLRRQIFHEASRMPMQLALGALDTAIASAPTVFKYRRATLAQVQDDYLTDPRLKALCATLWPYPGSPPSRLSFLLFSQLLGVIVDGPYYCLGSFQRLVDALVAVVERQGGDLVVNNRAGRVIVEGGRAAGVLLADGRAVRADAVVSNADAWQTFAELVGVERLPAPFVRRLRRLRPSLSAFVVYAATTCDLRAAGAAHETFLYKHWDHDATYADILAGRPGGIWANVPTLVDPSLAPPGEHLVIISSLAPYEPGEPWARAQARYTEQLLDDFDAVYPGLRAGLTYVESATPLTLEAYTRNQRGAAYGWENTPNQTGSKRLDHRTPLPGLYLAGHWTQEGTSSLRAVLSGINTARLVLEDTGAGVTVPVFRSADLPALAS